MPDARVTILGVPVDSLTVDEAVERLCTFLRSTAQHHVMTPNSEMLVTAVRDSAFHALLQRTALNMPDSSGLLWAARFTKQHLPERVAGVDAVLRLCGILDERYPVFLLGGKPGVAERAATALTQRNPRLRIAGCFAGFPAEEDAPGIVHRVQASGARVLLVAYGAPKQDVWIDRHLAEMPSVRVAMGVGGTFDFLAGVRMRAPLWMQRAGLEWAWRLLHEPRRLPRIVRATVVFPWKVIRDEMTSRLRSK